MFCERVPQTAHSDEFCFFREKIIRLSPSGCRQSLFSCCLPVSFSPLRFRTAQHSVQSVLLHKAFCSFCSNLTSVYALYYQSSFFAGRKKDFHLLRTQHSRQKHLSRTYHHSAIELTVLTKSVKIVSEEKNKCSTAQIQEQEAVFQY